MANDPYTLEQAESDIALLRGQVDVLTEILAQDDAGPVPNTLSGGYSQYSSSGHAKYASSDGSTYSTGRLTVLPPSAPVISSGSYADVGLTAAGGVLMYRIRGQVIASPNAQNGAVQLRFHGTNGLAWGTARVMACEYLVQPAAYLGNTQELTALDDEYTGSTFGGSLNDRVITLEGTVAVTTAGTVSLQAATILAAGTWTMRQFASFLEVYPVT